MLITILAVSLPFAWVLFLPGDFMDFAKSSLGALFFSANVFFYWSLTEYGADSALLKPLLHTWSLGVEEQFYIIFPFLLVIIYKVGFTFSLRIIFLISFCSFVFSLLISHDFPDFNFYMLPSRIWEFLVGAMLVFGEDKFSELKKGNFSKILPSVGLAMILISMALFDDKTPNLGLSVIPVLGTAIVLFFCNGNEIIGKIFNTKLLIGLGLISYSAYLWHFPIYAFARISGNFDYNYEKIIWTVLVVFLSILSYFLIEAPFRKKKFFRLNHFLPS